MSAPAQQPPATTTASAGVIPAANSATAAVLPPRVTLQPPSPYTHLTQPLTSSSLSPTPSLGRPPSMAYSTTASSLSVATATSGNQVRQPVQGLNAFGITGALTASPMRPSVSSGLQHQRVTQATTLMASQGSQKMQQNQQLMHQKMVSAELKQTSAPSSVPYRTPQRPQLPQQRPHLPVPMPGSSHQPNTASSQQQQQQLLQLHHQQNKKQVQQHPQIQQLTQQQSSMHDLSYEMQSQQNLSVRIQQNQQPAVCTPVVMTQRLDAPTHMQVANKQSGDVLTSADADKYSNWILSKRSIHELVSQIDPSEKLDPEVEEALIEIAEDFTESVTSFACSLAKHRKSSTLEAKDILLHAERCWNIQLPGYSGDEIKLYKKQHVNDIHRERLAVVKKSLASADGGSSARNSTAQIAGNQKN